MEFTATKSALAFIVLFAVLTGGTVMSPMSTSTVVMVSVGLFIFGILTLATGVQYGEYRARHS